MLTFVSRDDDNPGSIDKVELSWKIFNALGELVDSSALSLPEEKLDWMSHKIIIHCVEATFQTARKMSIENNYLGRLTADRR